VNSSSVDGQEELSRLRSTNSPYLPIVIAALIVTIIFVAIRCSKDSAQSNSATSTPENQPSTGSRLSRCFQYRSSENNRYGSNSNRTTSRPRRNRSNRFSACESFPNAPIVGDKQRYLGNSKLPSYKRPNVAIVEEDTGKIIMDAYQLSIDSQVTRTYGHTYSSTINSNHPFLHTPVYNGNFLTNASGCSAPTNLAELKRLVDNTRNQVRNDPLSEKKYQHFRLQKDIEQDINKIKDKQQDPKNLGQKDNSKTLDHQLKAPVYTSTENLFKWMRNFEPLNETTDLSYAKPPPLEDRESQKSVCCVEIEGGEGSELAAAEKTSRSSFSKAEASSTLSLTNSFSTKDSNQNRVLSGASTIFKKSGLASLTDTIRKASVETASIISLNAGFIRSGKSSVVLKSQRGLDQSVEATPTQRSESQSQSQMYALSENTLDDASASVRPGANSSSDADPDVQHRLSRPPIINEIPSAANVNSVSDGVKGQFASSSRSVSGISEIGENLKDEILPCVAVERKCDLAAPDIR